MPALAGRGIERISLTGGEPTLAMANVAALSRAAKDAGIATTLVTGLFWATSASSRRRTIDALPDVQCWNLSWDRFHAAHIKLQHVVAAAQEIRTSGADVVLRVTLADDDDDHAARLEAALPGFPIAAQSLRPVGRAGSGDPTADRVDAPLWPCLSTGPLVMPDGSARPCCSSMMDEPDHPFAARTARQGLVALHEAWMADPLLLLVRAIGFRPILHLLKSIDPDHPLLSGSLPHPCDVCATVFRNPAIAGRIADAARDDRLVETTRSAAALVFADAPSQP